MSYDNRDGEHDVEIIFGTAEPAQPPRPVGDTASTLKGFATGRGYGYACLPSGDLRSVQGHTVLTPSPAGHDGFQRLGAESALILRVPAGTQASLPLAFGFHEADIVTTGLPCRYYYLRHFPTLEDVLAFGLTHKSDYVALALARDEELAMSKLSDDQKWLLAQATHSYFGSTQLLDHAGNPLWAVNEGEYRMLNTFDLTVDHLFFELKWHPWAVRNTLDLFATRYAYHDQVHSVDGRSGPGGVSFTHDMGVMNQFSPSGLSSYECTGLAGCFSHMTMEQLVNWVLCAITYARQTGDRAWLSAHRDLLHSCATSLSNRDDPDPAHRNGLLKWDSDRCGSGSEITTYDSLDASLGQARLNLYLSVKTLAAWILLEEAFHDFGDKAAATQAHDSADLLAGTIVARFDEETGFFPAVFENGNQSRILPACEGLVFPLYLGLNNATNRHGRFAALLNRLERHLSQALEPGVCLDRVSGGWKLSSTSRNTWMSKIAIAQHVVRQLFPAALSPAALAADRVHRRWQENAASAAFAMCDQINSETGAALGSRYYPRVVTAVLWLRE